jgi:hypothetical protein
VNGVGGGPTFQLVERPAEVFQGSAVDELDLTGRGHDRDEARDAVDDRTKRELARVPAFLTSIGLIRLTLAHH